MLRARTRRPREHEGRGGEVGEGEEVEEKVGGRRQRMGDVARGGRSEEGEEVEEEDASGRR